MSKMFSVALSTNSHEILKKHLLRVSGDEDLCFALWKPSAGKNRDTSLIHEIILPEDGDRNLHGNVSFNPRYIERVLRLAAERNSGIAFLHSHITAGWQGMSVDDVLAEQKLSPSVFAVTDLPLVGLTLGTDGSWSARRWNKVGVKKYELEWASSVRVAGETFNITFHEEQLPAPKFKEEFSRTTSAWGEETQSHLMRLHLAIVGCGSVGSIIAESLVRMGIGTVTLLDFDEYENINRDRTLNVTINDIGFAKVSVVARQLKKSSTANDFKVFPLEFSVIEKEGFRAVLDCDLIFSCVDRPWPRSILNGIALAHLIPVIDGGISVKRTSKEKLKSADWRAHVVAPGRRCLECIGQFDPSDVALERDGHLDDLSYIEKLPKEHHLRRNENVFAFSLSVASMELMQMLNMIVQPSGIGNIGARQYHFVLGQQDSSYEPCGENCLYKNLEALGDRCGITWESNHPKAESARNKRKTFKYKLLRFFSNLKYYFKKN